MSILSEAVRHMVNAGMDADAIASAVEAMEVEQGRQKSKGAQRTAKWRERKASHASQTSQSVTCDAPLSSGSFPPAPPLSSNQSPAPLYPPAQDRFPKPEIVLQRVLDPMNAKRFVAHCAEKGRRMSSQSAEQMVAELDALRKRGIVPLKAVDYAIKRGWVTVDASWLPEDVFGKVSPAPSQTVDWSPRIEAFRKDGTWVHAWGPKPGESGCRAPPELVERAA